MKVTICAGCALGRGGFVAALTDALAEAGLVAEVSTTDCMSGCARPATCAFRTPGKTAYLFGDLTEADLPDLVNFARLYASAPDGTFANARVLGALRLKAIARIPG